MYKRTARKPAKPYRDFPLFPHATKRWAKKIRGRMHYFGPWHDDPAVYEADWQAALASYKDQADDLHAGREPRPKRDGLTLADLANRFLGVKHSLVDSGELSPRSFAEYHGTCQRLVKAFGKHRFVDDLVADDFDKYRASVAKVWGAHRLAGEVGRVRSICKYAYEGGLIDKPVRFGPHFKRPSARTMRQNRLDKGPKMLEQKEIESLLEIASVPMRAMILLGINCGFGNTDVATIPLSVLDLKEGWANFPRAKTAISRRCPLWPETVAAIKQAIADRPTPKNEADANLLFITKYGQRWVRFRPRADQDEPETGISIDSVGLEFWKLLRAAKIKRPIGRFYVLRHTFETIGGESRDQVAVNAIMGHAPASNDMSAVYRERISDDRLRAVVEHVRQWLFPKSMKGK